MSKYFILNNFSARSIQTLRDSTDQACRHLYHDKDRVFNTYLKSLLVTVGAAALATGLQQDAETLKTSLSTIFCLSTAYMAATIYECRKKINDLNERFEKVSDSAQKSEKTIARLLSRAFDRARESIPEMINLKKYPTRTLIALGTPIGSMAAVDGSGLALSIGAYAFSLAAVMGQETNMGECYARAQQARAQINSRQEQFRGHFSRSDLD